MPDSVPPPPPPPPAASAKQPAASSRAANALKAASSGLSKMKITAYEMDPDGSMANVTGPINVSINPESYKRTFSPSNKGSSGCKKGGKQTTNASGAIVDKKIIEFKETLSFELWFDSSGVIPFSGDVTNNIKWIEDNLIKFDKDTHATRYVKIAWGPMTFYGQLNSIDITYKQFDQDGFPYRAVASLSFEEILDSDIKSKMKSPQSADLTHVRTVLAGDTLPIMCYRIYKSPHYYLKVAEANGLANFTNIQPGQKIYFPPLGK